MGEPSNSAKIIWEQDGVLLESLGVAANGKELCYGSIRVIQKKLGTFIYWLPDPELSSPSSQQAASPVSDSEWMVVTPTGSSLPLKICVDETEPAPYSIEAPSVRPLRVDIADLQCIRISSADDEYTEMKPRKSFDLGKTCKLTLTQKDGTTLPGLVFPSGSAEKFMEILNPFLNLRRSRRDDSLILCMNPKQDLNGQSHGRNRRRDEETNIYIPFLGSIPNDKVQQSADSVLKFMSSMRKDPYSTTLTTFSKLYDYMLHDEDDIQYQQRHDDELAELIQSFDFKSKSGYKYDDNREEGAANGEDGYEVVVAIQPDLVLRPNVDRGVPLSLEAFKGFFDESGIVRNVSTLKKLVFKGGLEDNCRRDAWKYLVNYYPWKMTNVDREELNKKLSDDYYRMKLQWRTITLEQEIHFTAFKLRKDLIEKDVNRTDRNIAYYGGDRNPNLELLHDVLMTYVMYNFDLGYVQGMSDILAPILFVMDNEVDAFWCFVKVLEQIKDNFSLDQLGMKSQLHHLSQLLQIVDPHLWSYLESRESGNLFFCFRWLLVLFKREFTYPQLLKLWDIFWACREGDSEEVPRNFHLLLALAILDSQRSMILENRFGFTEILKHANDLALRLDLEELLTRAEAIYEQVKASPNVPNDVRAIVGLEPLDRSTTPLLDVTSPRAQLDKMIEENIDVSLDLNYV
ncbi:TBC1 domain family member 15-like isoform X1 [Artemia franciscana]|nr:hypothetical protein QYM36_003663 [Artemia franciscana]KAK2721445.1 hypothetical protein QYM36_003663 [Artemia franciscana]